MILSKKSAHFQLSNGWCSFASTARIEHFAGLSAGPLRAFESQQTGNHAHGYGHERANRYGRPGPDSAPGKRIQPPFGGILRHPCRSFHSRRGCAVSTLGVVSPRVTLLFSPSWSVSARFRRHGTLALRPPELVIRSDTQSRRFVAQDVCSDSPCSRHP